MTEFCKNWSNRIQNAVALLKNGKQIAYHATPYSAEILKLGFLSKNEIYWFADCSNISAGLESEEILKVILKSNYAYIWTENDPEPDDREFIEKIKKEGFDAILAPSNIALIDFVILKKENIKILGKTNI